MFKFTPNFNIPESVTPNTIENKFDHGFTDEEVEEIKGKYSALERRDKTKFPLTLEEQKIVFQMCRIKRNELFILVKEKPVKEKKVKVVKEKPIKVKKKTKKELKLENDKMMKLLFARNSGTVLSEEENTWLDNKLEEFENE